MVIGPSVFGYIADSVGYYWGWLLIAVFALSGALGFLYIILFYQRRTKKVSVG
jgi:MFS family permease